MSRYSLDQYRKACREKLKRQPYADTRPGIDDTGAVKVNKEPPGAWITDEEGSLHWLNDHEVPEFLRNTPSAR